MLMRRLVTGVGAAAVIVGASSVVVPAASAAQLNVGVNCVDALLTTTIEIAVQPGDTITFIGVGPCDTASVSPPFGLLFENPIDQSGPGPYVYTIRSTVPPGTYGDTSGDWAMSVSRLYDTPYCGPSNTVPCGSSYFFTITAAPAAAAETPIPMWVQAYGRPSADAPCLDGWDPSWSQWPNHGTGGFVCQRSIKAFGN